MIPVLVAVEKNTNNVVVNKRQVEKEVKFWTTRLKKKWKV